MCVFVSVHGTGASARAIRPRQQQPTNMPPRLIPHLRRTTETHNTNNTHDHQPTLQRSTKPTRDATDLLQVALALLLFAAQLFGQFVQLMPEGVLLVAKTHHLTDAGGVALLIALPQAFLLQQRDAVVRVVVVLLLMVVVVLIASMCRK